MLLKVCYIFTHELLNLDNFPKIMIIIQKKMQIYNRFFLPLSSFFTPFFNPHLHKNQSKTTTKHSKTNTAYKAPAYISPPRDETLRLS